MSRLIRHDRIVAWNTVRATLVRRSDWVVAACMLIGAVAGLRAWAVERPWTIAAWAALVAGAALGFGTGRVVAARLAFHGSDGLLAADALNPSERRRYWMACHGLGLAAGIAVTLIVRPPLLGVGVPAYLAGALIAATTGGLRVPMRIRGGNRPGWTLRAWLREPVAGLSAAAVLFLSALAARMLDKGALAVIGVEAALLALMLARIDDATVRFMAIAGQGARRIIVHHAKGLACFALLAVPGCWIGLGPLAAGICVVACAAVMLVLTLRILAYRLHGKRGADFLASIVAGFWLLVAYAMPVVLPVIVPLLLWQLHRRGDRKTWLLA